MGYQMQCDQGWVYVLDTSTGEVLRHHMGQDWRTWERDWQKSGTLKAKTGFGFSTGEADRYEMRCDQGWVYVLDRRTGQLVRHAMGMGWGNVEGSAWRQTTGPLPKDRD